jgi:hypothetical protein
LNGIAPVCLLIGVGACGNSQPPREPSAEDQIRAVIQQSVDAWNRKDANGYGATYCPSQREQRMQEITGAAADKTEISVDTITVNGGEAVAELTYTTGSRTQKVKEEFRNQDGQWLFC